MPHISATAAPVLGDLADPQPPIPDQAAMGAEMTANATVFEFLINKGFMIR